MSSLPETASAESFISTSLEYLFQECPQAYFQISELLAGREAGLHIGAEHVRLRFERGQILLVASPESGPAPIRLITDWETILDMADARLTLTEAALAGRLDLFGQPAELARFYEVLLTYLRGAVRCPSFPHLLDHLRQVKGQPG